MIRLPLSRFHAHVAQHDWVYRAIQGVLLYLPSLYFLPTISLLGFVGFSLLCFPWIAPDWRKDWALFAFAAFAACNTAYGLLNDDMQFIWYRSNGITGGIVMLLAYFSARTLTTRALYVLMACIGITAAAILVQGYMGVRIFFPGQLAPFVGIPYDFIEYEHCTMSDLASFIAQPVTCVLERAAFEPFALHAGPAVAVLVLLIGCWLTLLLPMAHRVRVPLYAVFASASIITNGRAALIIICAMTFFWIAYECWYRRLKRTDIVASFGGIALMGLLLVFVGNYCANVVTNITGIPVEKVSKTLNIPIWQRAELDPRAATARRAEVLRCHQNYVSIYPVIPEESNPTPIEALLRKMARYEIWTSAYDALLQRPLFGTHGQRKPVYHSVYANNGYLSLLLTHGAIGAIVLALFYCRRFFENPKRCVLLLPLLVSNVTNDTLFWYLSAADILAFYVLTVRNTALFPLEEAHTRPRRSLAT
jgi:hypothetical protein